MPASDSTILKLRNGGIVELPRRKIGELKDARGRTRPMVITDFSGIMGCQRCNGMPTNNGRIDSMAGMLWIVQIDARNQWHSAVAACNCVFGAWRNARGLQYADDLPHIPPGLSASDWRIIAVYGKSGQGWEQIVQELPEEERVRLGPPIRGWLEGDPPAYEPYPDMPKKMPEQDPKLEGQPAESSLPAYELSDMSAAALRAQSGGAEKGSRPEAGPVELPF